MSNKNQKTNTKAPLQASTATAAAAPTPIASTATATAAAAPAVVGPIAAAANAAEAAAAATAAAEQTDIEYPELKFTVDISEIDFHPKSAAVAVALVTGYVHVYNYTAGGHRKLYEVMAHKKGASARSIQFSLDGRLLFSGGADRSLTSIDVETGKMLTHTGLAQQHPITKLKMFDNNILISGGDDGDVKIWDVRANVAAATTAAGSSSSSSSSSSSRGGLRTAPPKSLLKESIHEHGEFISDICPVVAKGHVLCTSGDGGMSVLDMRKSGKLMSISDSIDDALLSVALIKGGKKIVCGSEDGILNMFSYDSFGYPDDTFPGHPKSIDSIVSIDDDIIVTGSSDGLIRIVQLYPHKLMGVVGEHGELPIETIRLSGDKNVLGSSGHDQTVKFWDVRYLFDKSDDGESAADSKSETPQPMRPPKRKGEKKDSKAGGMEDDDDDDEDGEGEGDDDDEDDKCADDDDDADMKDEKKGGGNSANTKSQSAKSFRKAIHNNKKFFEDL